MTVLAAEEAATVASSARAAGAAKTAGAGKTAGAKRGAGKAAQQRAQIDQIKASRPAADPSPSTGADAGGTPPAPGGRPSLPNFMTDQTGSPSWWGAPSPQATANSGSGFLLGVVLWAFGLAYLKGGGAGVRQLAAAKFLNKASGS